MRSNHPPPSGPIDIVYLWVDGNDPLWRAKRQRAAATPSARTRMAAYANVEGRFRDNDELRYSLRALERFFPGHGHVYLVTDAQTPAWLAAVPGITVVDHRDLIPASDLPTFDSGHIESYIHRIPGLSERYFYLNDDVFFGAPVDLSDWFWPGGVCVAWSDEPPVSDEPLRPDATALDNACRSSHQWLQSHPVPGYQHTFRTFAHAPRPMCKSLLATLEQVAPDMFARVRSTVFRTWDKPAIVSDFVLRWALAHGHAQLREYAHQYLSTSDADTTGDLDQLVARNGQLAFFCINDTTDDALPHDPRLARVRDALQQMFPQASRFETQQKAQASQAGSSTTFSTK
ncbi:MAG: Stealth CR1 domain-containing protein [Rhodoferax sp.]|uniref:Stealth CR1 domain-containing protein n=1 Tax=Rhodoferax sp. TaxID=50421 RepID=UPI0032655CD7